MTQVAGPGASLATPGQGGVAGEPPAVASFRQLVAPLREIGPPHLRPAVEPELPHDPPPP